MTGGFGELGYVSNRCKREGAIHPASRTNRCAGRRSMAAAGEQELGMPTPPVRFSQLRWLHNAACVVFLIVALVLIGLGLLGFGSSLDLWMVAGGSLILLLSITQMTVMPLLVKMESTLARQLDAPRSLHDTSVKYGERLEAIEENTRISDAAKSLAHRGQEVAAFQAAIQEDIAQEQWDAGLKLVDDMEHRFGYKQEAEGLREELDEARYQAIQAKLAAAAKLIETHFQVHDWVRAQVEIDRLLQALPDDSKVLSLVERMKVLREHHKEELLRSWDEAVRRNDVDHAIDILKELDQYMSPAEAEDLQTSARGIFKEKLLQLGVKFRFAVTEKRWQDALTTGLELVNEFPNARMADEVRQALDTLRQRARQAAETATAD